MDTRMRAALIALLLTFCGPTLAEEAPAGEPSQGRRQYLDYGCWQCHGTTGAGGGWKGPRLAPGPLPFVAFSAQLRKPRAQMPAYAAHLLSDQDVADIYAFLRSIPAGRPASQIDALRH